MIQKKRENWHGHEGKFTLLKKNHSKSDLIKLLEETHKVMGAPMDMQNEDYIAVRQTMRKIEEVLGI